MLHLLTELSDEARWKMAVICCLACRCAAHPIEQVGLQDSLLLLIENERVCVPDNWRGELKQLLGKDWNLRIYAASTGKVTWPVASSFSSIPTTRRRADHVFAERPSSGVCHLRGSAEGMGCLPPSSMRADRLTGRPSASTTETSALHNKVLRTGAKFRECGEACQ